MWQAAAGTVTKIIGDAMNARAAKKAQEAEIKAWETAKKYADEDRDRIINLYRESRGANGSALLPTYFGEGANSFETRMSKDLMGMYDAANDYFGPNRIKKFDEATSAYSPAMAGSAGAVNRLFTGQAAEQAEIDLNPVLQARTNAAKVNRASFMQSLAERMNAIGAAESSKGYSGTGGFAQKNLLGATWGANNAAAQAEAQADYENAAQVAALREGYRQTQLANASAPYQLALQSGQALAMPVSLANQSYVDQQAPLNWFKIGNQVPYSVIGGIRTPMRPVELSSNAIWSAAAGRGLNEYASGMMGGGGSMFGGGGQQQQQQQSGGWSDPPDSNRDFYIHG
jgi:hypothetical protein